MRYEHVDDVSLHTYIHTVPVNEKFPYRSRTTQTKCSVPVHGTNTGIDHVHTAHAFRFTLHIFVCIKFSFRFYGKKLIFGRFDIG